MGQPSLLRRGFKAECERTSAALRKELGLTNYEPLDAFKLAKHLEVPVHPISDLPIPEKCLDALHGKLTEDIEWFGVALNCEDGVKKVFHNDACAPSRQQSDIMHELSHIILKHPDSKLELYFGFPVVVRDPRHEEEAAYLGATLQLTKDALVLCYRQNLTIEDIAKRFTASPAMIRFRQNTSGARIIARRMGWIK